MADGGVRWAGLREVEPRLAAEGERLLGRDNGPSLLVTVRGVEAAPRVHPVTVGVVGDGLYVFLLDSAKRRDLAADGRYALHAHIDPAVPVEFSVRGRAVPVSPGEERDRIAAGWFFEVDDSYDLFELGVGSVILGERASDDEWPPRYTRWSAADPRAD
jgi:hypothetical protein